MTGTISYRSSAPFAIHLLLFAGWLISQGNGLQVVPTQVNLSIDSWSDADIEQELPNVCNRMVGGVMAQPPILAIGLTEQHLVVVTTDLFVFKLPANFDDKSLPPYHAFINSHPTHARQLWPESYPAIKKAAQSLLHAGIIGLGIPHRPDISLEYLLLVYKRNGSPCTLALDLASDQAIEGPCAAELAKEKLLVSLKIELPVFGFQFLNDGMATCAFLGNGSINPKQMKTTNKANPCFVFSDCHQLICIDAPKLVGLVDPFKGLQNPIVAAFTVNTTKFFFIEKNHNILIMENSAIAPIRQPLNEFFACYMSKPFEFSISKIIQIAILAVIFQTIICIFVVLCACYWPIEVAQPEDDGGKKKKSSSKLSRRRSSEQSTEKSVTKSRKSASKAGDDESHSKSASKSRKSASRQSKSTAGQSRGGMASKQ